ncbi:MAG: hypothetical protein NXH75_03780 [Halobacteriovoraceae bacterium]|nr:hypothetical protein [Halobacteriovoraceae bacterium]
MSPRLLKDKEREEIVGYCLSRYGVESLDFEDLDFLRRKEGIWLIPIGSFKENQADVWESSGLRILSGSEYPFKITMGFIQAFNQKIKKGKLEVGEGVAIDLLQRKSLSVDHFPEFQELPKGYYIFTFKGKSLGIALKTTRELVSQVPKSFSSQLKRDLKLSN